MNRKLFIRTSITAGLGVGMAPALSLGINQNEPEPYKVALVKEFVTAGHFNLEKVKQMLNEHPNLIYSRYDWGNGDFEEAIEGAGHKGDKDIANYLIEKGARVNLFVLTMLGKTNLVKPTLEAYPNLVYASGAHGLTLLHHAEVGGAGSKELYDYLLDKGLTETKVSLTKK